uniref:Polyketide synthase dehydratase domain-containing protein n=1 Tax=Plectus sambesii TaxID=2011161 RepID=A0A914UI39_9BILA
MAKKEKWLRFYDEIAETAAATELENLYSFTPLALQDAMGNGSLDDQTHESRAKTADSINGTPLLGSLLSVWKKKKSSLYESQLSTAYSHLTYVSDFRFNDDRIFLPQGTLLELLTEYSREKWRKTTLTCHLEAVEFHALLKIAADEPFVLQTLVKPAQSDADSLRVSSQGNDYTLTPLLTAVVRNVRDFECKPYVNFARLKATLNKAIITKNEFYRALESKRGTRYGRLMRAIDVVNVGECECLCLVDLGERTEGRIARLFEAVIQAIFYIEPNLQAINRIAEINAIYLKHRKVFVHAKFDRRTNEGAVSIYAEDGDTVCELRGVTGRMAEVEKAEEQDTVLPSKSLYTLSWTPKSTDQTDSAQSTGPWVYIGAESVGRTLKRLARQHYSSLEKLTISSGCLKSIISDLVSLIAETANLRGLLFDITTSHLVEDDLTLIEDTLEIIKLSLSFRLR